MNEDWLAEARRKKRSYSGTRPDAVTCKIVSALASYDKDCVGCPGYDVCYMEWPEFDFSKVTWDKDYIHRSKKL